MASIESEEKLDEQPTEEKPIIGNFQEPSENVNTNGANLTKSAEGMDKESTNLPSSRRHRKLPAELNREIFYCFNLTTRRKFICGLGWNFYAMFRQILLIKSTRLRNPVGTVWRSIAGITISNDGLIASKNRNGWLHIYADKGFPLSGTECRKDDFPGTICYYYEITISKSTRTHWLCTVGITDGEIPPYGWIGQSPNSYAIAITSTRIPNSNNYQFRLAGQQHQFEFPDGVIGPEVKETGNVCGCGLLMDSDGKLTIFFTINGILFGRQFPIDPTVDHLVPTVTLWDDMSVEANFGDNPSKPFEYDTKNAPEWDWNGFN